MKKLTNKAQNERLKEFILSTLHLSDFSDGIDFNLIPLFDSTAFDWKLIFDREDITIDRIIFFLKLFKKNKNIQPFMEFLMSEKSKKIFKAQFITSVDGIVHNRLTAKYKIRRLINLVIPAELEKYDMSAIYENKVLSYKLSLYYNKSSFNGTLVELFQDLMSEIFTTVEINYI